MQHPADVRSLKMAVAMYVAVFGLKLGAYFMSGLMSLFAEALHTLSDIIISGFLLAATVWSRKKADEAHMFGHGRAQNVAALVAATLFISFTSLELYRDAIPRLFERAPETYRNLPLALAVIATSMLFAAVPLLTLLRQQRRGAAARALFVELINDQLGLLAALVGTLFIIWGQPLADPLAAIVIATVVAYNAVSLFRDNLSLLLGRSPGAQFVAKLESLALSVPGVLGVHDVRAEYVGPDAIHADMHIETEWRLTIQEANHIAEQVRARVESETGCLYCAIRVDAVGGPRSHSAQTDRRHKPT